MQSSTTIIDKNWKDLIKPNKLNIKSNEDKSFTTVTAEPLEKGYALTIGNSLRRILLSSIQGSAITAIQIDGVLHEFSSIKGVREDVTDIVLNVKNLAIKLNSDVPKKLILDAEGPKEVKAKDIELVSDVKILNPEQTICNLDDGLTAPIPTLPLLCCQVQPDICNELVLGVSLSPHTSNLPLPLHYT